MKLIFVKHDGVDDKNYLFKLPEHMNMKQGLRVVCDTMYGVAVGTTTSDSFEVGDNVAEIIVTETGAYLPLKFVIGIIEEVMQYFDKPETEKHKPTVKEVRRPAEEGEYIKIVDITSYHCPAVYIGEILRVVGRFCNGSKWRIITDGGNVFYDDFHLNEYVVLENYSQFDKDLPF